MLYMLVHVHVHTCIGHWCLIAAVEFLCQMCQCTDDGMAVDDVSLPNLVALAVELAFEVTRSIVSHIFLMQVLYYFSCMQSQNRVVAMQALKKLLQNSDTLEKQLTALRCLVRLRVAHIESDAALTE